MLLLATVAAYLVVVLRGQERIDDLGAGLRGTPLSDPTVHYANPKYLHSGVVDPKHPQSLVYATTPNGPMLLGAMYMMPKMARRPRCSTYGRWRIPLAPSVTCPPPISRVSTEVVER